MFVYTIPKKGDERGGKKRKKILLSRKKKLVKYYSNKILSPLTFNPGSFSNKGLQYTGTGTGTWLLLGSSRGIVGWNFAGRLQPYACILPSSFLTWTLTCLYCSHLSLSFSFFVFSEILKGEKKTKEKKAYCKCRNAIWLYFYK